MAGTIRLLDLQRIDERRDEAMARLKHVVGALKGDQTLRQAQEAARAASEKLAAIERELRRHDLERQSLKQHIAEEERTLYGGRVTAPKELQNLELEIQSLRRRLAGLDDTALELMLARDEADATSQEAEAALEATASTVATETESLTSEQTELTAAIRDIDREREEIAAVIPPADLALYERLRRGKGGVAVARTSGEHCGVCGIQLPRQDLSRARTGEALVQCTGCGRILVG
jgi:predicted  nucleic acid-binding Zn-ribbon protein